MPKITYLFVFIFLNLVLLNLTGCENPLSSDESSTIDDHFHPGVILSLEKSEVTVSESSVLSGNSLIFSLQLKDNNGNIFTEPKEISFSVSGGIATGAIGSVTSQGNGKYSAVFSAITAGTALTVNASIDGQAVTNVLPSFQVLAGNYSLANSAVSIGSGSINSGNSTLVTLTVKDASNNQLSSGGINVTFSILGGGSTGTFSAVTDNQDGTYTSTFTGVLAGSATAIQAQIYGDQVASSLPTVTVVPSSTIASIEWSSAPLTTYVASNSSAMTSFSARLLDAAGNTVTTNSSTTVTLSLTTGTGSLAGTLTKTVSSGVATFSDITYTKAESIVIKATENISGHFVSSSSITVSAGAASQLVVSTQPTNSVNGVNFATAPAVTVKDANNNIVTSYATPISIAIGANPSAGALSGTTSITPASGVSTFSNLQIDLAGTGYTLTATSSALSVTSSSFNIVSYKPTTVTATSSQPLEYFTIDNSTAITPTYTNATVAAGGQTPALGGLVPTGTPSVSGSGVVPPLAGSTIGSGSSANDASASFTATVNVGASLTTGATSACLIQSPFNAVSCLLPSFNISSAQLTTTGNLSVRAYAINGGPLDYLNAPAIPVKRKVIEKFMVGVPNGNFQDMSYAETNESVTLNSKMYFIAANAGGFQKLFVTDGSTITQLPNTCGSETCHDKPSYLTVFNSKVYFTAVSDNLGLNTKLYSTDGSSITQISNTRNNQATWDYSNVGLYKTQNMPVVSNNKLLIRLINSSGFSKLYGVDTSGSLEQISNTKNNNSVSDNIHFLTAFNGNAYFTAANSTGSFRKLFKYDGAAITQISNTSGNNGVTDGVYMFPIATSNSLFFWANNSNAFVKLFKYDGSSVTQVSNITNNQALNDSASANAKVFGQINLGGKYIFHNQNINSIIAYKMFQTDGTSLTQISNTLNSQASSDGLYGFRPEHILSGELYFSANNPSGHRKLYKTNGTTVTQVSNINNGSTDDAVPIGIFDNDLYFEAKDPSGFYKLYKTNGTEVLKVADFNPGQHDFDDQVYNCNGYLPVFWISGSFAYISVTNTSTCIDTLYRIKSL